MTIQERVKAGAELLDGKVDRWWEKIDIPSLEMADGECCIIGQLYGNFFSKRADVELGECELWGMERLGFVVIPRIGCSLTLFEYDELQDEWVAAIQSRRNANLAATPKPVTEEEVRELVGV